MQNYDIAAYVWPSYTGKEKRALLFWPEGIGEWQTVKSARPKFEGHILPRVPTLGYLDEADPAAMAREIDLAVSHGVNVFIYDWYWYDRRPFLEQCLDEGFLGAPNRDKMRFYLMWANHDATYLWDKRNAELFDPPVWLGTQDRVQFEILTDRVIDRFFSQPNYYKLDGKPVFSIYDLDNLVNGLGGMDATCAALDAFREKTARAGFPGLELQAIVWRDAPHRLTGEAAPLYTREIVRRLGFDSVTHYQIAQFTDIDRDYDLVMEDVKAEWDYWMQTGIRYYPHVSVGWDTNPRFKSFIPGVIKNNTPAAVGRAFEAVKAFSDRQGTNLITVNSWNEWTEMSYLLPDQVYGTGYLEEIKRVFGIE